MKKKEKIIAVVAVVLVVALVFLFISKMKGNELAKYIDANSGFIYQSQWFSCASVYIDGDQKYGVGCTNKAASSYSYCIFADDQITFAKTPLHVKSEIIIFGGETIEEGKKLKAEVNFYNGSDRFPVANVEVSILIEGIYAVRVAASTTAQIGYCHLLGDEKDLLSYSRNLALNSLQYFDSFLLAKDIGVLHRK